MNTSEVEALAKVAETAFVMGGSGGWDWDDAIHADCEEAGVVPKLRDVAEAVARAVRAQDEARGAHTPRVALHFGRVAEPMRTVLREALAAQGRTISALTLERDSNKAGWDDAIRERDEARAELAKTQGEFIEESSLYTMERESRLASEFALATLRQAVGPFVDAVRAVFEVHRAPDKAALGLRLCVADGDALLSAYDATTSEHPDTATLRAVCERARDADAMWDAFRDGCKRAKAGAKVHEEEVEGMHEVVRYLLGDSGPSGGEDKCARCGHAQHWQHGTSSTAPHSYCSERASWSSPDCGCSFMPTPTTPQDVAASEPKPTPDMHALAHVSERIGRPDLATAFRLHPAAQAPTPEEDWRTVEAVLVACADENTTWPRLDVARAALTALARLKAEPRRAREAMRERCAKVAQNCQCAGDSPGWRAAQAEIEETIRALPL